MATVLTPSTPFPILRTRFPPFNHLCFAPSLRILTPIQISTHRRSLSAAAAPEIGAVEEDQEPAPPPSELGVEESVAVLKKAAKTRRVSAAGVLAALAAVKKAKLEPSQFLETLGGAESPGRTWMLIFTAEGRLEKGRYFPLTAVQRFDAAAKRIENGVYLGPIGCLTFEGKFSWNNRMLAFIFEQINIKVGPLGPFKIKLKAEEREPSTKDPFFIWFYVDEEIGVAQGRSGGIAFWCRCHRVT